MTRELFTGSPATTSPRGVRVVFVAEASGQGAGFPIAQITAPDGHATSSVILDCQQQLFLIVDATTTGEHVVFHDDHAEQAAARLPRTCPVHRL